MKSSGLVSIILCLLFFSACKKAEDPIPFFEKGKGRITGAIDNGFSFDVKGGDSVIFIYRPAFGNGDELENVYINVMIDGTTGKYLQIKIGNWKGKGKYNTWHGGNGYDDDYVSYRDLIVYYTNDVYLTGNVTGIEVGEINITRVSGDYIEGNYKVRLQKGYNVSSMINLTGNFQGNLAQ